MLTLRLLIWLWQAAKRLMQAMRRHRGAGVIRILVPCSVSVLVH